MKAVIIAEFPSSIVFIHNYNFAIFQQSLNQKVFTFWRKLDLKSINSIPFS